MIFQQQEQFRSFQQFLSAQPPIMPPLSIPKILFIMIMQLFLQAEIINISPTTNITIQSAAYFTTITSLSDLTSSNIILSQLAVPGFSRKHGYNYIALDGWSCSQQSGPVISLWKSPNTYLNDSFAQSDSQTRKIIKKFYEAAGVKLLVNAFSSYQNPVTQNLSGTNCANKLLNFIDEYEFDGANIDIEDTLFFQRSSGMVWLSQFSISLGKNSSRLTFTHSFDATIFDMNSQVQDYSIIERMAGESIQFYNVKYSNIGFASYQQLFTSGNYSVLSLAKKGIPLNKIVISKPSQYNATGFVRPNKLIHLYRKANALLNWWGGAMFSPYLYRQSQDQTRFVTLRRDNIEPISAVNLDFITYWWPPQKTVADIGVPGYASNNMYNNFIFGTWTCKSGDFDISKLWSQASFYLSTAFGNTTSNIQQFLKNKYQSKQKNILVRAFGAAESPTTGNQDPIGCALDLATYIKTNNLDGVDINYQDNIAFSNGFAEEWLIAFTNTLRAVLPFHLISHSILDYLLDKNKYKGGSYTRVISTVGVLLDFYQIQYYGQQHTSFTTYQQLFLNSGMEYHNISITQLISQGFDIDKIVIGKPVNLFDAQGTGFIDPLPLREIFLQANANLDWRGGICYSSFINDKNGESVLMLLRGMNKTDSKRFAYVDNVNIWWPPQSTLAQMGVPTLASPNIYNYFAYTFWTYKQGPLAISKVYNDPITYLGTTVGKTKSEIQIYIKELYSNASVKLLVSAFGASQFPVNQSVDAVACAASLVQFMNNNLLDGIDIDFEDSQSFVDGVGEQWVNTLMRQIRRWKPFHIITHAPQAPYFSPNFSQTGSYLNINEVIGKFIDFYNIQFYNQGGNTTYSTYQELFFDSGSHNPNSSLFQIINSGVQVEKAVLGKPVTKADSYNTGYISNTTIKALLKQAVKDGNNPGWTPSVMYWQYLSDLSGSSISQAMSYNT